MWLTLVTKVGKKFMAGKVFVFMWIFYTQSCLFKFKDSPVCTEDLFDVSFDFAQVFPRFLKFISLNFQKLMAYWIV